MWARVDDGQLWNTFWTGTVLRSNQARSEDHGDDDSMDMTDADDRACGSDKDNKMNGATDAWVDARRATKSLFPERDPSQKEHMRSTIFGGDAHDAGRRSAGGEEFLSKPSAWLPLPPPLLPRPRALGNLEDAEAAVTFRPKVDSSHSSVLRLLANAWKPTAGEVAKDGARGTVRAGRTAADLGLRCGRGFRASWGPGGELVVPGTLGDGGVPGTHAVRVVRFNPTPAAAGRNREDLYVPPLRNHLRFAQSVNDMAAIGEARVAPAVAAARVPPRWALPRRRNDDPAGYNALVKCMHGYAAAHSSPAGGGASDVDRGAAGKGARKAEDSPEWVLEQSWLLASAIWGQEPGEGKAQDLPMPGDMDIGDVGLVNSYDGASSNARRDAAVGDWLAKAVASCVPGDKEAAYGASPGGGRIEEDVFRTVLELLSVRRVEEAAQAAMSAGLPRLAVVLTASASMAHGFGGGAKSIAQQATLWQGGGADARMPQAAFAVYQLLGREGFRDVSLRGVINEGSDSLRPSLDWLRQLGLCLWFGAGAPAGSSRSGAVAEAVGAYESLVKEGEALPPTARYFIEPTHHNRADLEQVCDELRRVHVGRGQREGCIDRDTGGGDGGEATEDETSGRDRCVLSRLLAMYPSSTRGSTSVGVGGASGTALLAAMEPLAVTPDVMDYRHSWNLMNVVEALGVAQVPDRARVAAVTESLRFQLVSAGLWEWAVYVALTAEGSPDRRAATAKELIMRHGHGLHEAPAGSADAGRLELLDRLQVPREWQIEAAAVHAG